MLSQRGHHAPRTVLSLKTERERPQMNKMRAKSSILKYNAKRNDKSLDKIEGKGEKRTLVQLKRRARQAGSRLL